MSSDVRGSMILALQSQFDARELTTKQLVNRYLERIARYDKIGPCINAVSELNPDVLQAAEHLDQERTSQGPRSLLHGLPIFVKDNILTQDRLNTSLGSHFMLGMNRPCDAPVVSKLRRAGVIIMGKSNMDELASGNGTPSGRGGQVRNPYCPTRNASGSSGGSAAAAAADFCPASLATDTHSSLRFPASDCSLVGIRPTAGLLSTTGIFPALATIDAVGPIAATVVDSAILLRYLADLPLVHHGIETLTESEERRSELRSRRALKDLRIATQTKDLLGYHPGFDAVIERALSTLAGAGAKLVEIPSIRISPYGGDSVEDRRTIQNYDRLAVAAYFESLPDSIPERSIEDFLLTASLSRLPTAFSGIKSTVLKDWAGNGTERNSVSLDSYHAARDRFFAAQRERILEALASQSLDILVFPTKSVPASCVVHSDKEREPVYRQERLSSYSGLPEITVPAGYTENNLPVGLSFVGPPFSEARLLDIAFAFEQHAGCWHKADLDRVPSRQLPTGPPLPKNDLFERRQLIHSPQGSISGNSLWATIERFEPRHGLRQPIDRSVWFTWQAPGFGRAEFRLILLRASRHTLAVYSGDTLRSLHEVACGNYEGLNLYEVSFSAAEGAHYQIAIGSNEMLVGSGEFILEWSLR